MHRVIISGIGVEIPPASVSNEELVASFNAWVARENGFRAERGEAPLSPSDENFILHASGVRRRHFLAPEGVLDPERMSPRIAARAEGELSVMAEFGVASARRALEHAGVGPDTVDMVICAASHHQRPYPAIAIEIQDAMGMKGAAFDMNLGCSSAVAALHVATGLVRAGAQRTVLIVSPEIISGHLDFRDRQTHFIFGDASASLLVSRLQGEPPAGRFEVLDTRGWTQFSSSIRSDFGFLSRAGQEDPRQLDMSSNMIRQAGSKVFKDVTAAAHRFIVEFLADHGLAPAHVRRFWLHQANRRMNAMIMRLTLGHEADQDRAPIVLDEIGNTAAAGAIVALKEHHEDMQPGDLGLFCAFGAGYSIGCALLRMH